MIVHEYETVFIIRPEVDEAELGQLIEKLEGIIGKYDGSVLVREDWGRRKLAYPINKHFHGIYLYLNYTGSNGLPRELERNVRIDDNLIRFLTVRLSENVDVDATRQLAEERQKKRLERRAASHDDDRRRGDRRRRDDRSPRSYRGPRPDRSDRSDSRANASARSNAGASTNASAASAASATNDEKQQATT